MDKIDRIDIKILKELQEDARLSIVNLANRVSLTATPCARRVHNLEKMGLLRGYVSLVDQSAVGLSVNAFIEVKLIRERVDEIARFEAAIKQYPEIMECYALSGGHDYLLRVVAPDLDRYHTFLRETLLAIHEIESVQTSFALDKVIYRTSLPLDHLID